MTYKDKIVIQTYVSKETYDMLKHAAEGCDRPLSSFVRTILNEWIKNNSEKDSNIRGISEPNENRQTCNSQ